MKTLEKMILCCIWICIALVMVLIKDQVDLNHKIGIIGVINFLRIFPNKTWNFNIIGFGKEIRKEERIQEVSDQ